jgi:hypothetical protein
MKNILPIVIFSIVFSGCNQDFLNTLPLDKPPASTVWADPSLSEAFVTDIYNVYHDGHFKPEEHGLSNRQLFIQFWQEGYNGRQYQPGRYRVR